MRVSLVNPPILDDTPGVRSLGKSLYFNSPPLGLAYLGGVLEKRGIPVQLVDAAVEQMDYDEVVRRVRRFDPDVVGLTATTFGFRSARGVTRRIRERLPGVITLLGGPHVTHDTTAALAEGEEFDYGVVGEGEELLPLILEELDRQGNIIDFNGVRGMAYRTSTNEVHFTGAAADVRDLDSLPFPARHLLPLHLYKPQPVDQREVPKMVQLTSRGCPYLCTFCEKAQTGYRSHSPARIVDEMFHLHEVHGGRDVAFVDSMFAVSQKRLDRVCDEMERRPPPLTWTCTVRANSVNREMLQRMKKTGCWRVRLGIESGSEHILKLIRKDVSLEQVRNAVTWADELGLQPKAFFIVGHYGETAETIQETIEFAKSIPLSDVTVQLNTPLKGTEQYELVKDSGRFQSDQIGAHNFFTPAYVPEGLTEEDLLSAWHRFYREFYLRPVTVRRHLREIRRLSDVKRYLQSADLVRFLFTGSGSRPPQEV